MKKNALLLFVITLVFVLSGCRYEEGPVLSLTSVKKRLAGFWEVVGFTCEGLDSLQYYKDSCGCEMGFYQNTSHTDFFNDVWFRDCYYKQYLAGYVGEFRFDDNKNFLYVYFNGSYAPTTHYGPILINSKWEILRLTKEEFKISSDVNGKNYIVSFEKME